MMAVLVLAAAARQPGMTRLDLWRDDAWTALAHRVDLRTALRMSTTTPGFTLIERAWIGLRPNSSLWAQVLPLLAGLGGVIAIFALARFIGISRPVSVAGAFVVAVSPVCVQYSTHIKQYSSDFLLSCLILGLYERTRRGITARSVLVLAGASAVVLVISASLLPVVVGVWCAIALEAPADRPRLRHIFGGGAFVALVAGALYVFQLRRLSPALHEYWADQGATLDTSSLFSALKSAGRTLCALTVGLFPSAGSLDTLGYLDWRGYVVIPAYAFVLLLILGAAAGRRAWGSTFALLLAIGAYAFGWIPLGTGRTDEALYPALLVLVLMGAERTANVIRASLDTAAAHRRISLGLAVAAFGALAIAGLSSVAINTATYPELNVRALASEVAEQRHRGDHVLVDPYTRYPWALYQSDNTRILFGDDWGVGFTVASTDPHVFIAPSEPWERGFSPAVWTRRIRDARRVWYVGTRVLSVDDDPIYQHLRSQRFTPMRTVQRKGSFAILMTNDRVHRVR
jgi:hypothetical protein